MIHFHFHFLSYVLPLLFFSFLGGGGFSFIPDSQSPTNETHFVDRLRCSSPFQGPVCAQPCPFGSFGVNCSQECTCRNSGLCDHISGQCQCTAGYIGERYEFWSETTTEDQHGFTVEHLLTTEFCYSRPNF